MVTTPVQRPDVNDPVWGGRHCCAALVSQPGHWVTYVVAQGAWWRVEGPNGMAVLADPFQNQTPNSCIMFLAFTI
jgi:hypothetical protein